MANLRGVDVIGQGLLNGIPGLADALNKHVAEMKRREEVNQLVSGLLNRSKPQMGGLLPIGGMQVPLQMPGTDIFSPQNSGDLGRLGETSPQTLGALKATVPQAKYFSGDPEGQYVVPTNAGGFPMGMPQTLQPPMPRSSQQSMANDWQGEFDKNGNPIWKQVPNTNKTYQPEFKWVDPADHSKGKIYKGAEGTEPGSGPGQSVPLTDDDTRAIAEAIARGEQPPDMKGLFRYGGAVRKHLANMRFDLTTANKDWQAMSRHISTLNGPQQERLRQAVNFTYDSIDIIEELYGQLEKTGLPTGYRSWNKLALAAAKQMPGETSSIATRLEAQINDLTSEMATVYKGGNASTDESLRLAAENLKSNWNPQTFKSALDQLRRNLLIRKNSINTSQPQGVSPNSVYARPGATVPPPANDPNDPMGILR